jgi:hypothetical protein
MDICKTELVVDARNGDRLFDRMVVLDWLDGPRSGILVCRKHDIAYKFTTLAIDNGEYDFEAWDAGHEIQILGLTRLSVRQFAEIVEILSITQPPQWPIWYRGPYKDPAVYEAYGPADAAVDAQLEEIENIDIVIAVHAGTQSILEKALAVREIDTTMTLPSEIDGWFSFLGYSLPDSI